MIRSYIKIAWRNLQKRKVFSFINILGLALGFGCSILIFLYANYHLQFDNFHHNENRIHRVVTEEHQDEIEYESSVPPGFAEVFKSDFNYAEKVANIFIRQDWQVDGTENNSNNRLLEDVVFAEPDFFQILNFPVIKSLSNRDFTEPNVAYITKGFAKKMFGDHPALGQTFVLENKETIQVIGLLKDIPTNSTVQGDIFVSYESLKNYSSFAYSKTWGGITSSLQCYALLRPDQDIAHIEKTLIPLVSKYRPESKNVHRYKLQKISDVHFDHRYGGINANLLWIFSLIGMFLIIIACINFINISTAQAFSRSKEIGVRKVLGVSKNNLFWQFILETFLISLFALLIGLTIALIVLPKFNELFQLQLTIQSLLTYQVFGFATLLLVVVSFLAGSYPGILMARILPTLALKGKLTQNDTGGKLTRKVLVTTQFGISIMLIVATIVISKQINYAITSDLGFDKEAMVMLEIPEQIELIKLQGLKDRLNQIPGVSSTTACLSSPGAAYNDWGTSIRYHNRPQYEEFSISAKLADKDYLSTFNLKLIAGRNFFSSDSITEVVVNERFAEKLGLSSYEELIGKSLEANRGSIKATIVGVISNFHDQNFQNGIGPVFIAPEKSAYNELAVKMDGQDVNAQLQAIENRWKEVFPKFVYNYSFLDERVAAQYREEQRFLSMTKLFSGLAIFISCLGLYGLISFFLARKTREIGIRKILGGKVKDILAIVLQDFLKLILIAGAIASPIAWYFMNNWLQNYAYHTEISWWIFVVAISVLLIITILTISYQAIKAATANPIKSLKTE
ncbi:ABC transporter permease [uncultured Aquimarina sp.]|uniref:ABC transporter permease n=1 Tax=uncultured Aquimarina sp. TaxID=575652 RepID=UPI0026189133|nr:ABC transporter permease [uncultured Aquimarina sp.]